MEIEGHPTQDIIEELERRGAIRTPGSSAGPNPDTVLFLSERLGDVPGMWVFLPRESFMTGLDDPLV